MTSVATATVDGSWRGLPAPDLLGLVSFRAKVRLENRPIAFFDPS